MSEEGEQQVVPRECVRLGKMSRSRYGFLDGDHSPTWVCIGCTVNQQDRRLFGGGESSEMFMSQMVVVVGCCLMVVVSRFRLNVVDRMEWNTAPSENG